MTGQQISFSNCYVYPKLQRTGLGNMLFLWAKAEKLCQEHRIPMIAPDWVQLGRIGPWLRREKYKRYYTQDFTNKGYVKGLRKRFLLHLKSKCAYESLSSKHGIIKNSILLVSESEGFRPVIDDHLYVNRRLLDIISPKIKQFLDCDSDEYIGVHVRRGDFKIISQDLPIEWYVNVCQFLRSEYSAGLEIRVFSDASTEELTEFEKLKNCRIMPKAPAIQDLLSLANSQYIVGTSMSTFSLWASYLKRKPTFWSPVSPGVHGYGLSTDNHVYTDWNGLPIMDSDLI